MKKSKKIVSNTIKAMAEFGTDIMEQTHNPLVSLSIVFTVLAVATTGVLFGAKFIPLKVLASSSGACSWHDGVNCYRGADWDGSVICNDGWKDSDVSYSNADECAVSDSDRCYSPEGSAEYLRCHAEQGENYTKLMQQRNAIIRARFNNGFQPTTEEMRYLTSEQLDAIYSRDQTKLNLVLMDVKTQIDVNNELCKNIDSMLPILEHLACHANRTSPTPDQQCKNSYGSYSYYFNDTCNCFPGYYFSSSPIQCLPVGVSNVNTAPSDGANSDASGGQPQTTQYDFVTEQISEQDPTDPSLVNRLKGLILLQVENHGAAWYLHPITFKRYYLKDGATAYEMLRTFGLGVSEENYAKIASGDVLLKTEVKGRIILRVQAHGEAYYINPKDLGVTYLKDGEAAYQAMRHLSLGISDADIAKIPIERFVPIK